jgi:hypothetical protein
MEMKKHKFLCAYPLVHFHVFKVSEECKGLQKWEFCNKQKKLGKGCKKVYK